jgi:hypothetical protein
VPELHWRIGADTRWATDGFDQPSYDSVWKSHWRLGGMQPTQLIDSEACLSHLQDRLTKLSLVGVRQLKLLLFRIEQLSDATDRRQESAAVGALTFMPPTRQRGFFFMVQATRPPPIARPVGESNDASSCGLNRFDLCVLISLA